ncbi:NAD(P)-binding domain protein [Niveomyces insectorum RCEF 264]|uniref:3beta-hydroxysteroid 3-dehydrogenase n=1 Tax=Niveomyces insectorum RCEF 264 TaxID=1081102 RepID=A0A167QDW3_9HYPO|nr:NAD(P)-binding domain protein [Niveomyces insectorum RCEF 264]
MAPEGSILVTGANGTLGSAIVGKIVANADWAARYHGLYTVRDPATAKTLQSVLKKAPAAHAHDTVALDLSRLQSVRDAAADLRARVAAGTLPPIRALVWNAGFQEPATQTFTDDGYDMTFQANYLGHWLLTVLLLGSMDKEHGRVVIVGSWTHDTEDARNKVGGPDYYSDPKWATIFTDTESLAKGTYSSAKDDTTGRAGMRRYGAGKLCEVMMIRELQERLDRDPALSNVSVLGVDPGGMMTTLMRHGNYWFTHPLVAKTLMAGVTFVAGLVDRNGPMRPPTRSAGDVLQAALATAPPPLSAHPKGLYFNGNAPSTTGAEARDPAKTGALATY